MEKHDLDKKICDLMVEANDHMVSIEVCQRVTFAVCTYAESCGVPVEVWESVLIGFIKTAAGAIRMREEGEASIGKIDDICKDIAGGECEEG